MSDQKIKSGAAKVACPTFDDPAFVTPPDLKNATVAIVTSASLHHADDDDFAPADVGYRVLDRSRRDIVVGHWSPNFDATGVVADLNVVFPASVASDGRSPRSTDRNQRTFALSSSRNPAIRLSLERCTS